MSRDNSSGELKRDRESFLESAFQDSPESSRGSFVRRARVSFLEETLLREYENRYERDKPKEPRSCSCSSVSPKAGQDGRSLEEEREEEKNVRLRKDKRLKLVTVHALLSRAINVLWFRDD